MTTMGSGVVLTDDSLHDEDWYQARGVIWKYWDDYAKYLTQEGWSPLVLQSLDTVTSTILGLLHDPIREGEWERRGLVIGHVQSGKTANYIGLISKAADAGYKFIIVIAGIHNELRKQTQERVDRGFIGRDSVTKQPVGVGLIDRSRAFPVTVTTTESDFNRSASRNFGVGLNAVNNTFILIIKKNASTLSHLYSWLRELNTRRGFEQIADIPMLLIDDEADNASINTSKPDLDPTRINREIRRILNLFRKKCYVGYTATPFANIFIDPDARDVTYGADLFPEHFIYSLDAPSNYFGYHRIFLDDEGREKFVRLTEDADGWLPADHRKDTPVYELPALLSARIHPLFILARAVRNVRGQTHQHCSMLVNVSRFVDVQREVRALVEYYLGNLRKAVRYNYALPWAKASQDSIISELYHDFQQEYGSGGVEWHNVLGELNLAADVVKIAVVNSRSQEKLLFSEYNRDQKPLTLIAIGGLSLSRGLMLYGLTVSYIHRSTKMYDTLLQMGRWFGYRPGYERPVRY
ncbi:MAG: Z1 domain-containing protein [Chloroflexi bacterium]|nr:Z1 domain-containing protein [Chloroflexota bacterium]